jgi:CHAT domain-containing protein/tetratricopeptide (TPR) repeat protein
MRLARRLAPAILLILIMCAAGLTPGTAASGQSNTGQPAPTPPWQRQLTGADASRVEKLEKQIDQLKRDGRFSDAIGPAGEVAEIRAQVQGDDHWQTADARRDVDDLRTIAALPEEGRKQMAMAEELARKATTAIERAQYAEGERLSRTLLEIYCRWLGEGHRHIASYYNRVGFTLYARGRYTEAETLIRKALAISLKAVGEDHHATAMCYGNIAANLDAQGKYLDAEPFHRTALATRLKALGEGHLETAMSYTSLANNLDARGRYAEAEPLHRTALAIRLKLGEDDVQTAVTYVSLQNNLTRQGKYAEAEPLVRKALPIYLRVLGEGHRYTATGFNNLAVILMHLGKHAEAEPLFLRALAINRKVLGENHRYTADVYRNLALNLERQEKYAEAEPLFRQALAIRLQVQGENHPETARNYNELAANLDAQGRCPEAEPLHRTALAIRLKAVGEDHPHTALSYNDLAANLDAQGKLAEAIANWTAAAAIYERSRGARGASGWERSLTSDPSPLPALAMALAGRGQPRDAWLRWEADLARGLLDDLSARALRPLTLEQRHRDAELAGQLQQLDESITRLATRAKQTQDRDQQLDALRHQQNLLRGQWVEFQNALDRQYQAFAGKPSTLAEVQKALPTGAALVGWLDVRKHHWACVLRKDGEPIWVKVPGSGREGTWTREDDERPARLRAALAGHQPDWLTTAEALARLRLTPLSAHLKGVDRLIILPSPTLAGVSIEALVAALPEGSPRPVVSYAPSGSMFARLAAPRSRPSGPPRLVALGDPAFLTPAPGGPAPTPPDHGVAILAVVPNGTADLFGIRPGDVLLEYNGKALKAQGDLAIVPAGDQAARVPIKLWRDGEVRSLDIAAGPLDFQSTPDRPAAQVVLAQRAAAEVLRSGARAVGLVPLPGTRREVEAIAALFPEDRVTTLLGPAATESNLQGLARSGALKGYRFVHMATHGQANRDVALNSAIFLAAEPERPGAASADPAARESAPDGRVTAEQIVRTWDLDADLVVLSACESGLGRYAGGEGYLGFAQALFVKGARSLVLSQWRVDDKATSLLMARFYRNLLGKRPRLSKPMPKAEALHEAKEWLRNLTADEVGGELAALDRGGVRPLAKDSGGAAPGGRPAPGPGGMRPYAHPYYWAAFLLIGDPD